MHYRIRFYIRKVHIYRQRLVIIIVNEYRIFVLILISMYIQYTIYNIQYTIYNIQYTIYNIQYTIIQNTQANIYSSATNTIQ